MRAVTRLSITFLLGMACGNCGTAYTYAPSPTSSDNSTTGSTSTTSTTGGGQAGGTGAGATAGGASAGATTGVVPVSLLNLQVDGNGFGGGQGYRGSMADEVVSAQVLSADATQKVGNATTGDVQSDGSFTLDFNAVLNPNTAYGVAVYIDSDHNGQCDDRDTQFLLAIHASNEDVDVQLSRGADEQSVCDDFQ